MSALTLFPDAYGREAVHRSFDLSKFPNLEEVKFGFSVRSTDGGLSWIPVALSTLKPVTSPHLSAIRLDFADTIVNQPIKGAANDLRWISAEIARIEREFEGAVNFTMPRDPGFEVVLETLNVWFYFVGGRDLMVMLILAGPSTPQSLRWACSRLSNLPLSICGVELFGHPNTGDGAGMLDTPRRCDAQPVEA